MRWPCGDNGHWLKAISRLEGGSKVGSQIAHDHRVNPTYPTYPTFFKRTYNGGVRASTARKVSFPQGWIGWQGWIEATVTGTNIDQPGWPCLIEVGWPVWRGRGFALGTVLRPARELWFARFAQRTFGIPRHVGQLPACYAFNPSQTSAIGSTRSEKPASTCDSIHMRRLRGVHDPQSSRVPGGT
jgi:hypothetical protein